METQHGLLRREAVGIREKKGQWIECSCLSRNVGECSGLREESAVVWKRRVQWYEQADLPVIVSEDDAAQDEAAELLVVDLLHIHEATWHHGLHDQGPAAAALGGGRGGSPGGEGLPRRESNGLESALAPHAGSRGPGRVQGGALLQPEPGGREHGGHGVWLLYSDPLLWPSVSYSLRERRNAREALERLVTENADAGGCLGSNWIADLGVQSPK